ncbi:MAG: FUN14 domain-containing protein [Planctomycetes bacterium]|nr:FUN14 domain-containing protein [Planctomycetota bacterium]MCB9917946.1 FUN14 domain-containing protein [Planctomycetota bacterium]
MAKDERRPTDETPKEKPSLWQRYWRQPGWKKLLLLGGSILIVLGVVFQVMAWVDPPPMPGGAGGNVGPLGSSFTDPQTGEVSVVKSSETAWSEGFLKLGFSFFAGFAIGSFVRGFLKMFLFFAGGLLVVLVALEYFEVAKIDWSVLDRLFNSARDKILGESNSFREFLSSRLPSGGLGALGLFTGFKKS